MRAKFDKRRGCVQLGAHGLYRYHCVGARCVTQDIAVVWCCNSADRAESRFGWRTAACPAEMLWAGMSVLLCRLCLEDVPLALSHPSITGLIRAGWAPGRQDARTKSGAKERRDNKRLICATVFCCKGPPQGDGRWWSMAASQGSDTDDLRAAHAHGVWMLARCSHGCSPLEERQPLSLVSHNGSGFVETMSSSKKQSKAACLFMQTVGSLQQVAGTRADSYLLYLP